MTVNRFGLLLIVVFAFNFCGCGDPKEMAATLLDEAADLKTQANQAEGTEQVALLEKTINKLRLAIEKDPTLIEAHVALVSTLWGLQANQVEAVRMSETLTTRFPDKHEIWELAGNMYANIFKWKEAVEAYEKAMSLGGNAATINLKIGLAAGKLNDMELAFEAYDAAAQAGADELTVNFNLGLCYEATNQYEMALDHYMMVLNENETYLPVINKLASAYIDNKLPGAPDLNKALKYAKKAFELTPSDIKVLGNLVDILIIKKDYEPALKAVDTTISHEPDESDLQLILKYRTALVELMNEGQKIGDENNSNQKDQ